MPHHLPKTATYLSTGVGFLHPDNNQTIDKYVICQTIRFMLVLFCIFNINTTPCRFYFLSPTVLWAFNRLSRIHQGGGLPGNQQLHDLTKFNHTFVWSIWFFSSYHQRLIFNCILFLVSKITPGKYEKLEVRENWFVRFSFEF